MTQPGGIQHHHGDTPVQVHCYIDGDFTRPARAITVQGTRSGSASRYIAICPKCGTEISDILPAQVARLLLKAGAIFDHIPEEAVEEHEGPPISADDVLDFVQALEAQE